jgi:hypothetical protein
MPMATAHLRLGDAFVSGVGLMASATRFISRLLSAACDGNDEEVTDNAQSVILPAQSGRRSWACALQGRGQR